MSDTNNEKIVYFVRHGESEGNVGPVYQGFDSPLSARGKEQADLVASRVGRISFDSLIVSPLPRTRQTAEAITKITGKVPEYSDLFVERIKPTRLNGRSTDDEDAHRLNKEWTRSLHTSGVKVEDGENFDEIIDRAGRALEFLEGRPEKNIVVVTHGYFMRTILARILLGDSLTEENYKNFTVHSITENTGISVVICEESHKGNKWLLWIYNDHSHLG